MDRYSLSMSSTALMVTVLRAATAAGVNVAHRVSVIVNKVADEHWLSNLSYRRNFEQALGNTSPIFAEHPISNIVYLPYIPAASGKEVHIVRSNAWYRQIFESAPIIRFVPPSAKQLTLPLTPDVFISHAGLDKEDVAMPLHDKLVVLGFRVFLDKIGLRPGNRGEEVMLRAMRSARLGIFIVSPEFAGRKWTLRELVTFLDRREEAEKTGRFEPAIIPVFYRLNVRQCRSDRLYKPGEYTGRIIFDQGFFEEDRQKEIPTRKAAEYMKRLTKFTGIENDENAKNDCKVSSFDDKKEHSVRRERLVNRIIASVKEHLKTPKGDTVFPLPYS